MTRGRKPKPEAMKQLAGNPGKRTATGMNTPQPDAASERAPRGMSDEARRFWHGIAKELIELNVLRTVDVPAFVLMAEHYALARKASEQLLDLDSLTTIDKNDAERKHPLLQVFKDNAQAYRMFAAEFGLTPSSRSRLNVPAPEGEQLSLADELFGMVAKAKASRQELDV